LSHDSDGQKRIDLFAAPSIDELRIRARIAEACAASHGPAEVGPQLVAQEWATRDASLARRPGESEWVHAIRTAFHGPSWQQIVRDRGGIG
jgi:hypothetical protein